MDGETIDTHTDKEVSDRLRVVERDLEETQMNSVRWIFAVPIFVFLIPTSLFFKDHRFESSEWPLYALAGTCGLVVWLWFVGKNKARQVEQLESLIELKLEDHKRSEKRWAALQESITEKRWISDQKELEETISQLRAENSKMKARLEELSPAEIIFSTDGNHL